MSFTETLQSLTGKLLADCTDQELYLALLELVRRRVPTACSPSPDGSYTISAPNFSSASCCPTTSSIWGLRTKKPGMHRAAAGKQKGGRLYIFLHCPRPRYNQRLLC